MLEVAAIRAPELHPAKSYHVSGMLQEDLLPQCALEVVNDPRDEVAQEISKSNMNLRHNLA